MATPVTMATALVLVSSVLGAHRPNDQPYLQWSLGVRTLERPVSLVVSLVTGGICVCRYASMWAVASCVHGVFHPTALKANHT